MTSVAFCSLVFAAQLALGGGQIGLNVLPLAVCLVLPPGPRVAPSAARCTCDRNKVNNGWCRRCALGHVAGVQIRSYLLFDTVDTHSHDVLPDKLECRSCRRAVQTDGFCDACRLGYVNQRMYFTALTYSLAKATIREVSTLRCTACLNHARAYGWCDLCAVGMIGSFAFRDRSLFDVGVREYRLLQEAVIVARRCEECAAVMFTGAECARCKVEEYRRLREQLKHPPVDAGTVTETLPGGQR